MIFTKEELQIIYLSIPGDYYPLVKEKVKFMLDNYCEHDWENTCCNCNLNAIYCNKCEKTLEDL